MADGAVLSGAEKKCVEEIYTLIETIADKRPQALESGQQDPLEELVNAMEKVHNNVNGLEWLRKEANAEKDGETILHFAIKKLSFDTETDTYVIQLLVENFEALRFESRLKSDKFRGQTPLHLAVTKGTTDILEDLLDPKKTLLQKRAVGGVFKNTVMMAELPLSVAALKNDQSMFHELYRLGAELDGYNGHGDNVCHSLVRYAYLYPDKLKSDVMQMLQYISEGTYICSKKKCAESELSKTTADWIKPIDKIWAMKNKEGLSPLQLAAKFGQHEIFKFIMGRKEYCFQSAGDGLFDVKVYDVTEIDAISFEDPERFEDKKDAGAENASKRDAHSTVTEHNISILRRVLELDSGCAIEFITFPPVGRIIDEKWAVYRKYFWPWFILHIFFMSYLSWYSTFRSLQNTNFDGGFDVNLEPVFTNPLLDQPLSLAFGIINILAGLVILFDAGFRCWLKRMPLKFSSVFNPYSNLTFRFLFILFGLSLIGDFIIAASVSKYENYLLMLAVFIGWFLMLFFLRAFRAFSYFTVMIQHVLTGDLFRFAVVIICELIGFTTVMFMALQGASEVDSEYSNYWRVLLSMFKLMVGLGDVGLLYQTRHPVLTIIILIGFIVLTTLLMINSLIAMISRTSEDHGMGAARYIYWKLQRLSMVLYIESVLPINYVKRGGEKEKTFWYNNQQNCKSEMYRYCLKIKSLLNVDNNENTEGETSMTNVLYNLRQYLKAEKINPDDSQPQRRTTTMRSLPSMEIYNHNLCTDCSKISEVKSHHVTNY